MIVWVAVFTKGNNGKIYYRVNYNHQRLRVYCGKPPKTVERFIENSTRKIPHETGPYGNDVVREQGYTYWR